MSANLLNQNIENQTEELLNQSIKVQYPILGSIPEINQIPYVDMNNQIEVTRNLEEENTEQRQEFLISFYLQLVIRTITILIFLLLSYMNWFRAIVIKENRRYYNQHYSFQDYLNSYYHDQDNDEYNHNYYHQSHLYEEYIHWKDNQYNLSFNQRWTFWTFFGILIALLLLTVAFKRTQFIKSTSKINFYLQNILISFLVVGIIGVDCFQSDYGHIMWTTISSLIIIMSFFILQLVNVKLRFQNFTFKEILSTTLIISFILNLIRAFSYGYIPLRYIFIEIFIAYPIYYFQQLNQSVMEPIYKESECKCNLKQSVDNFVSNIKINDKDIEVMKLVQNNYFVIKKIHLKCAISIIILVGLILLCIFKTKFLILLGIIPLQLIGLLFQTQIISNNKNIEPEYNDTYLSVCQMIVDILFPIKNIQRSIWRIKGQ